MTAKIKNKLLQLPFPEENAKVLVGALKANSITNRNTIAAVLAVSAKESGLVPKNENLNYTTAERLRTVWPSYFPTTESAQPYVRQPEKLAEKVYGGRYGNNAPGDGYKYRGRGFNGITFKDQYRFYSQKLGVDLVANPDQANRIDIASNIAAVYFLTQFESGKATVLERYGAKNINDFNDLETAVEAIHNANAGWKAKRTGNIYVEGLTRAKSYAPEFKRFVGETGKTGNGFNIATLTIAAVTFGLLKSFS